MELSLYSALTKRESIVLKKILITIEFITIKIALLKMIFNHSTKTLSPEWFKFAVLT